MSKSQRVKGKHKVTPSPSMSPVPSSDWPGEPRQVWECWCWRFAVSFDQNFSAGKTSRQSTQCRKQGAFQVEKELKRDKNLKNLNNMFFFLPLKRCLRKNIFHQASMAHGPMAHEAVLGTVILRLPKLGWIQGFTRWVKLRRRGSWGLPIAL